MRHALVATTFLGLLLVACSDSSPLEPESANGLRSAPTSVNAGGVELTLAPYLWRDFQPISPPDGSGLIAVLRVQAGSGGAIPASVHVLVTYVVNGDAVWASATNEDPRLSDTYFNAVARGGPTWGPGVNVDVVVRLSDGAGNSWFLRAADQPIHRTD